MITKKKIIWFIVVDIIIILSIGYLVYDGYDTKKYLRQVQNEKVGIASWYGKGVYRDGTIFKGHLYSCASVYFKRYSLLMVEHILTGKKILVYNSDVHEASEIIIDLSKNAFSKLSSLKRGKITVRVTYLGILKSPNELIFGKEIPWKDIKQKLGKKI